MTIDQALKLRAGDYVTHRMAVILTNHHRRPIRVTDVWVNDKRTIVLLRLASIDATAWLDATGYEPPPDGMKWDAKTETWIKDPGKRQKGAA